MHPLVAPIEPHFVHLSWAVRRLTPTQARYIRLFYGEEVLHQLEELEHRHPMRHLGEQKPHERHRESERHHHKGART